MRTKSKSSTTTELLPNPHPGEILAEDFLTPMRVVADRAGARHRRAAAAHQ